MDNKPDAFDEHVKDSNFFSQRVSEMKNELENQKETEIKQIKVDVNNEVEKKYQDAMSAKQKQVEDLLLQNQSLQSKISQLDTENTNLKKESIKKDSVLSSGYLNLQKIQNEYNLFKKQYQDMLSKIKQILIRKSP